MHHRVCTEVLTGLCGAPSQMQFKLPDTPPAQPTLQRKVISPRAAAVPLAASPVLARVEEDALPAALTPAQAAKAYQDRRKEVLARSFDRGPAPLQTTSPACLVAPCVGGSLTCLQSSTAGAAEGFACQQVPAACVWQSSPGSTLIPTRMVFLIGSKAARTKAGAPQIIMDAICRGATHLPCRH